MASSSSGPVVVLTIIVALVAVGAVVGNFLADRKRRFKSDPQSDLGWVELPQTASAVVPAAGLQHDVSLKIALDALSVCRLSDPPQVGGVVVAWTRIVPVLGLVSRTNPLEMAIVLPTGEDPQFKCCARNRVSITVGGLARCQRKADAVASAIRMSIYS